MPDFKRGASTISQQLAKNLYLSSERSFMRKGQEAIITYFMERSLSKKRILELYLNVIEWGDGIYGAEAASQYYFHKPAANLNAREAAFLSAMIPNPRTVFNPQVNPKRVARRQRIILRGMPSVKMPAGTGLTRVIWATSAKTRTTVTPATSFSWLVSQTKMFSDGTFRPSLRVGLNFLCFVTKAEEVIDIRVERSREIEATAGKLKGANGKP